MVVLYWIITIVFILTSIWLFTIKKGRKAGKSNMHFLVLIIASSFFFGSNMMVFFRIGIWMLMIVSYLIIAKKSIQIPSGVTSSYIIFYIWIFFTLTYSEGIYEGLMMLVKFAIPIFFFLFSYSVLSNKQQYIKFLILINQIVIVYVIIHGIAPVAYLLDEVIGYDFFGGSNSSQMGALVSIPLFLFFVKKDKRHLLYALIYLIPPLTYIRRAALLGFLCSAFVCLFYRHRLKSLLLIVSATIVFIFLIFSWDDMRERFFGGDRGPADISFADLSSGEVLDHVNSSGRDVMWEFALNMFYYDNPLAGCGLGTLKQYFDSEKNLEKESFALVHNDYLQLLCETGLVGLLLYIYYLFQILFSLVKDIIRKNEKIVKMSALATVSSFTTIIILMYFENILSTPLIHIIPFILMGLHFKLRTIYEKKAYCLSSNNSTI